jgi:hypothetical protein
VSPAAPQARLLLQLEYPGFLRMFGSTVRELAARGNRVLLAYDLPEKKRSDAARAIEALDGVEIAEPIPWGGARTPADVQRRTADYLRYLDKRLAGTPYQERIAKMTPPAAIKLAEKPWAPLVAKPYVRAIVLRDRFRPPDAKTLAHLERVAPDAVVVSPLVARGRWGARQADTVKACQSLGIPVAAAIASWDHLTTKGIVKVAPDRVLLWNEVQRREAIELHRVPADRIVITGAQLFDQWFAKRPTVTREEFLGPLGLDPARPVVLYVGSSPNITAAEREVPFVRRWIESLRAASPRLRDAGVLVRPHPGNVEHWAGVDLEALGAAIAPRLRPGIPMSELDEQLYFHSIHFAEAVVGINTSAIIEALIQRRPVFSIRAAGFAQEDTLHFHYLVAGSGGCVKLAGSLDEHVAQLEGALADPEGERAEIDRFLSRFVRPHGLDRPATPILADAIEALAVGVERSGLLLPARA